MRGAPSHRWPCQHAVKSLVSSQAKAQKGQETGCRVAGFGGKLGAGALSDTGVSIPLEGRSFLHPFIPTPSSSGGSACLL